MSFSGSKRILRQRCKSHSRQGRGLWKTQGTPQRIPCCLRRFRVVSVLSPPCGKLVENLCRTCAKPVSNLRKTGKNDDGTDQEHNPGADIRLH